MRQLSSLFGGGDFFDISNFTPIPKVKSPVPSPQPPPKEVYTVPVGSTSLVFDKWSYKFTKYTIIIVSIGIVFMITTLVIYLLVRNLANEAVAPADETSASQIQNFMNAALFGFHTSTGAGGFKVSTDCNNPYNNCVYTSSTNTFSCVASTVNPDIPIWTGPRCQDPIVSPYYATLVDGANSGLADWGKEVGSGNGDPSQLLEALLTTTDAIGATYDLTFTSTRFNYVLYSKSDTNQFDVLQTQLLDGAYPVVNFNEYSNGVAVIFKSLQNIGTGEGSIRIASTNTPPTGDLINGTGSVTRLDLGGTIIMNSPYAIFNGDQALIQFVINGVTSTSRSNFIPLTNQDNQKITITLLGN